MSLIIWSYIFGGATIFALVVGIFSVWNGRMTRREVRDFIEKSAENTEKMIRETSRETQEVLQRMDERNTELLARILEKVAVN